MAVDAAGAEAPAVAGDGKGRRYYMTSPEGYSNTQTLPPANWSPVGKSDGELHAYGYPARPVDSPSSLTTWNDHATAYKAAGPPGYCETTHTSNSTSQNWSGYENTGASSTTYHTAGVDWVQTAFDLDSNCPYGATSYSTWAGIGGDNASGKLIQTGTDTSDYDLNGIYAWWEALSSTYPNPETAFNSVILPGDSISATVDYDSSSSSANFSVFDSTQGILYTTGYINTAAGHAMSNYYYGNTAEYITEAPGGGTAPGGWYYLRKPHLGNTYLFSAYANTSGASALPHTGIDEQGYATGRLMQTAGTISSDHFYTNWHYCY